MKRLTKKVLSAALALTLAMAVATTSFGATWSGYFGQNSGWYEGAEGSLTASTSTSWTATMSAIGWGGCWGAQAYLEDLTIPAGYTMRLVFNMTSTNCNKLVYIKVADGETIGYNDWIYLTAGETYKYDEVATIANDATSIYFGIGGEFYDRQDVDTDASIRYAALEAAGLTGSIDTDATAATTIKMTGYKMALIAPATKKVKKNVKNLLAYLKAGGAIKNVKQGKYKVTIKASGKKISIVAKKGSKKVINVKIKAANAKKILKTQNTKASKAVSKVLKAYSGLTLKNIGGK